MKRTVVRSDELSGIYVTDRDHRLPPHAAREIENATMQHGRLSRRAGLEPFAGPFRATMLTKHTSVHIEDARHPEGAAPWMSAKVARTPGSYALLPWHDDFQLFSIRDGTIEFLLNVVHAEEFVTAPHTRLTRETYGGVKQPIRGPTPGAAVYDMSVTANFVTIVENGVEIASDPASGIWETLPVTTLAVFVSGAGIQAHLDLPDVVTERYRRVRLVGASSGGLNHVAVRYTVNTRTIELLINGELNASEVLTADERFAGEADFINGRDVPIRRNIVLLNEYTVRGAMSSTCKLRAVSQTSASEALFHYPEPGGANEALPNYLCLSPPAGTGMRELRYWHSARTGDQLKLAAFTTLTATDTGLAAYFPLDDGGAVCSEQRFDAQRVPRLISLHHGNPGYVIDQGLLGGRGIYLADGQYVARFFGPNDFQFVDDAAAALAQCFESGHFHGARRHGTDQNFTVQIQVRTPPLAQEINARAGDADQRDVWYGTPNQEELGRQTQPNYDNYGLLSGDDRNLQNGAAPTWFVNPPFANLGDVPVFHRAFDQTLWSIEAQGLPSTFNFTNGQVQAKRHVLARCLYTPDARVAFEFFGYDAVAPRAREFRLVSSQALSPNQVFTITCRKRALVRATTSDTVITYGYILEIFVNDVAAGSVRIGGTTVGDVVDITGVNNANPAFDPSNSPLNGGVMPHGGIRTIAIGASYIGDPTERGLRFSSVGNDVIYNWVTQRYMSPWQDQPAVGLTVGFFRMWTTAITNTDIQATYNAPLVRADQDPSLLYDLSFANIANAQIPSFTAFASLFDSGFTSWGVLTTFRDPHTRIYYEWANEDRLGYGPVPETETRVFRNARNLPCRGIIPYASTLQRRTELLAVFGGALYRGQATGGAFSWLPITQLGLLNDYFDGERWFGTSIGDRTILTSTGSCPKVYNGRYVTTLGLRKFGGGYPHAVSPATQLHQRTPAFTVGQWYAIRIGYYAETEAMLTVGPATAVLIVDPGGGFSPAIEIFDVSPHPDPRVTSIIIGVSQIGATTRETAMLLPTFFAENALPNRRFPRIQIETVPAATQPPLQGTNGDIECFQFSAAAFNRLYLAGGSVGDAVYFSDAGNPENINTATNRLILEEGNGDRIVAMRQMAGDLWIGKPNSIWRVSFIGTDVTPGGAELAQHQVERVSALGPAGPYGFEVVSFVDDGRTALVGWSRHGPFVFDGINTQYIGYPIEGAKEQFEGVDHASVRILHDQKTRELCFFARVDATPGAYSSQGDIDTCWIFNYRLKRWSSKHTGVIGGEPLSFDYTESILERPQGPIFRTGPGIEVATSRNVTVIGGDNGRIYRWGSGIRDGVPTTHPKRGGVSGYDPLTRTLQMNFEATTQPWLTQEMLGLWCTIIRQDLSAVMSVRIIGNSSGSIQLATQTSRALLFDPEPGDLVEIGLPPVRLVLPWDDMDSPYADKQLIRATVWAEGDMLYSIGQNWEELSHEWRVVPMSDSRRRNIEVEVGDSEAYQFKLLGIGETFEFDSRTYQVQDRFDGNAYR